jgi:hypothetical protein
VSEYLTEKCSQRNTGQTIKKDDTTAQHSVTQWSDKTQQDAFLEEEKTSSPSQQ